MKFLDRGYWVAKLFYFQSVWYWIIYSVRFQSITFFSAINPAVHLGGMLDERKSDIYKLVPPRYLPKTVATLAHACDIEELLKTTDLEFPLIVKPNIGLKGFMVKKVDSISELEEILKEYDEREVLLQEFLTHEREFSLLYYQMPNSGEYGISSFIEKKLPCVIGDGKLSLMDLIDKKLNPFLKKEYILRKKKHDLNSVVVKGEKVIIDHVGNYSRGSKFYSLNNQIDEELIESAHRFFSNLDGLFFGRVDLKANSIDDVRKGNFKIIEINGAKAEPLHIYDPNVSFGQIFKAISFHWNIVRRIVSEQVQTSFLFPSAMDGIQAAKSLKKQIS